MIVHLLVSLLDLIHLFMNQLDKRREDDEKVRVFLEEAEAEAQKEKEERDRKQSQRSLSM
jgi:hypothetical protein